MTTLAPTIAEELTLKPEPPSEGIWRRALSSGLVSRGFVGVCCRIVFLGLQRKVGASNNAVGLFSALPIRKAHGSLCEHIRQLPIAQPVTGAEALVKLSLIHI